MEVVREHFSSSTYAPWTSRPQRWPIQGNAGSEICVGKWPISPFFCSSGQKRVPKVFRHLPSIFQEELKALVAAIEDFTMNGHLWGLL